MVKTTITTSIDAEIKNKAYDIIHYEYRKSFSGWLNDKLVEVIKKSEVKKGDINGNSS